MYGQKLGWFTSNLPNRQRNPESNWQLPAIFQSYVSICIYEIDRNWSKLIEIDQINQKMVKVDKNWYDLIYFTGSMWFGGQLPAIFWSYVSIRIYVWDNGVVRQSLFWQDMPCSSIMSLHWKKITGFKPYFCHLWLNWVQFRFRTFDKNNSTLCYIFYIPQVSLHLFWP